MTASMDRSPNMGPRPSAKTDKIGFLHLNKDIRNRIYQLAIYDHDRGAVFLPRTLPRRSVFQTTGSEPTYASTYADVRDDEDTDIQAAETDWDDTLVAAEVMRLDYVRGHWTDGIAAAEAEALRMEYDEASEPLDITDVSGDGDADPEDRPYPGDDDGFRSLGLVDLVDLPEIASHCPYSIETVSRHLCDGHCTRAGCHCSCHKLPLENITTSSAKREFLSKLACSASPACRRGECVDETCEDCKKLIQLTEVMCPSCQDIAHNPPESDEVLDNWAKEQDENLYPQADEIVDDAEHFDSEETIGMLYEPKDPGILLACREIRNECLPIYYKSNTFTWRFFWLDYTRSFLAFNSWVANLGTEHARHIQKITFEGRHAVEEGVDFDIDIDLLVGAPYFSVQVSMGHWEDQYLDTIRKDIERDLIVVLWQMLPRTGSIKLSPADLTKLGRCFVNGMHR